MKRNEIISLITSKLNQSKKEIIYQWNNPVGTNTKHFYIDDFLPHHIVELAYNAFPKNAEGFYSLDSFREKKKTSRDLSEYDPILGEITYALQDKSIVSLIDSFIKFDNLEPDPTLARGGLSMMLRDDFLNPHLDNSHDATRNKYRRLNLLYYVSPDWKLENGGNFELWDEAQKTPTTIVAKQNRLLVMETHSKSWHSVSKVTVDQPRCCISNYYYSDQSPDSTNYYHVTSFTGRPEEKIKRTIGAVDNILRNAASKILKKSRSYRN